MPDEDTLAGEGIGLPIGSGPFGERPRVVIEFRRGSLAGDTACLTKTKPWWGCFIHKQSTASVSQL